MAGKAEKMPKGLEVAHLEGQLRLSYRHHRGAGAVIFLVGLCWVAMLVPALKVLSAGDGFGGRELIAFLPFFLTATGFCYVGLAKMLNTSEISISTDTVSVRHHPLPWFGNVELPLSRVADFAVARDFKPQDARHRVTLALVATLDNTTERPLLRAIDDAKAAHRMHQEASAFLQEVRSSTARGAELVTSPLITLPRRDG